MTNNMTQTIVTKGEGNVRTKTVNVISDGKIVRSHSATYVDDRSWSSMIMDSDTFGNIMFIFGTGSIAIGVAFFILAITVGLLSDRDENCAISHSETHVVGKGVFHHEVCDQYLRKSRNG